MVEFVGSVYTSLGSVLSCSIYPASLLALRLSFFSVSTYLVISQFEWYLAAAWVTLSVFSSFFVLRVALLLNGRVLGCLCLLHFSFLFILDTDYPFPSTRLETRTKECNVYASVWVAKPLRIVKAINCR